MADKIRVQNMTNGRLIIDVPDLRFHRIWEQKGAVKLIDKELFSEVIYDPGVEYMIRQGMIAVEDDEIMEEVGQGEEIVILTDAKMRTLLKGTPIGKFKEEVSKLPKEQLFILVDFAIENEIIDMDKNDFLRKLTGTDITKAVQLKRQEEEEVKVKADTWEV